MGLLEQFRRLLLGKPSTSAGAPMPPAARLLPDVDDAADAAATRGASPPRADSGTAVPPATPPAGQADSASAPGAAGSTAAEAEIQTVGAADTPALQPVVGSTDGRERRVKPRLNARPGTKVLIIDDSATIVALLARMLRQNHCEILEAEDAESGLVLARAQAPDLIFLDIVLPGMNGFTALRHLRRDPVTKATPIIMISGNEQATEQFYVQRIGADDFMKKPFSRAEVFARIDRLLDADRVPRRPGAATAAVVPG